MRKLKQMLENIIPKQFLSFYHFVLAFIGAVLYRFPSRRLIVIGVTGTKGKSSTTEMLNTIFEEAGHKTALLNSIRVKVGEKSEPNLMRMTMPGRFFIQRFLSDAGQSKCTIAILEMTSQGAVQHRHRFIDLDALIFTNLAPEHIESHGSYEKYADAKFEIARELARSRKRPRIMVANADDKEGARYLVLPVEQVLSFSLGTSKPWSADERGGSSTDAATTGGHFRFDGTDIAVNLPGEFSLKNALASATLARALGVNTAEIASALSKLRLIPGRAEEIKEGQNFTVVVDYAHTPDSLEALYGAYGKLRKICVLGATGGGRDTWKRRVMGGIADKFCDEVILTNEDPYDEDPRAIIDEVASGTKRKPLIIMDRREAVRSALSRAHPGDAVLITGKGTDPCICVANGGQIPWSDAEVAREEIRSLLDGKKHV
ncbi:MAG: UDP-N-acetylmuramyl-tripeptide synthetase [Candidatus Kaiserbacteria bacterium]|nr:UDP-N-acetylmuramyl-tripeptide synthetase [Candidatus Kaiserbacteria bacterium]